MMNLTKTGGAPCVAIVAPGGYAPDEQAHLLAQAHLVRQGCSVRHFYDPQQKFQRFGGSDAARAAQLHAAAADAEVDIVLALRGGYGMSRLLPLLDLKLLAQSGKLFVGHSDFTALQMALLSQGGACSFAGPMVCDDFSRDELSELTTDDFWRCLAGPIHTVEVACGENPALDVSGMLWGGNLAMLSHLCGTPYMPDIDGGIFFVEDVNEHPFRVERMLLQLLYSGMLARQKALVLGDFSNYRLGSYDNGYDFAAMLDYLRSRLSIPVLTGLPFGHIRDKVTLAVGCDARLESQGQGFRLTMANYPTL
jgi:muramoyltetrapeptide carboxypeptidase